MHMPNLGVLTTLAILARVVPAVAQQPGMQPNGVQFKLGEITFTQGGKTVRWALKGGGYATLGPGAIVNDMFFTANYTSGPDCEAQVAPAPGCLELLIQGSGGFGPAPIVELKLRNGPAGDASLAGTAEQCRIAFKRRSKEGVEGSGDCNGAPFGEGDVPIGKFTFSALP